MAKKIVAPSILSADFCNLERDVQLVCAAGADWVHVDVMDGQFVRNLTIGIPVVAALKRISPVPLDVHLMIVNPEVYINDFIEAGADILTIHLESSTKVAENLKQIRTKGKKAGISLRPGTPVEGLLPFLGLVDLVLVMTVEPGFGGQSFRADQVPKIQWLVEQREKLGLEFLIEVDGGVNDSTLIHCHQADALVAGSHVFKSKEIKDLQKTIEEMKNFVP
jgi:ribulose-phosphate 3-epimerase